MSDRELTPPPDGRLSSSSGSPDSVYKSSTDSNRSRSRSLKFSPDGHSYCPGKPHQTSTAFKEELLRFPPFKLDDVSDVEWDSSFASPPQKRPPPLNKIRRTNINKSRRIRVPQSHCYSDSQQSESAKTPAPQFTVNLMRTPISKSRSGR